MLNGNRRGLQEACVLPRAWSEDAFHGSDIVHQRHDIQREVGANEQARCLSVFQDVRHLARMQLRIYRYGGEPAPPDAVEHLKVFRAIGHEYGDALACSQPEFVTQETADAGRARRQRAVIE